MNPSSVGMWCNPPPPGTDEEVSVKKESPERVIDRIDPFLKSSEYLKYEKRLEHRRRSRSKSRHHRRRSRSRSRGRHRRRRRRYSSSRSRSRSPSRSHRRHKRSRHSRSRTRRERRSRSRRRSPSRPKVEPEASEKEPKVEEELEEEEDDAANENQFKNDGSFMEMFKKMQEEQMKQKAEAESATPDNKTPQPAFGKRRGGKVLKTGLVQKNKSTGQEEADTQDAWTLYMKEVKRYKEACCDDDSKTRLLVK